MQAFPKEAESFLDADIIIGNTDVKKTVEKTIEFLKEKKGACFMSRKYSIG